MPSNTLDDLLFSVVAAHSRTVDHTGTQTIFLVAVVRAILTAVLAGLFTVTVNMDSAPVPDIMWVIEELRHDGYTVSTSTDNIVISW
jgi:hypothetical protein